MKRLLVLTAIVALTLGLAAARTWVPLEAGAPERSAEFRVLTSSPQHTVVELTVAGIFVEEVTAQGQVYQALDLGMAAGAATREVGAPQLPTVARLISIPGDRAVQVRVTGSDFVTLPGYRVYPAQAPQREDMPVPAFTIDAKRYAENSFYPVENARTSDPMIMRDYRVVQLVVQPAQFNPVTGALRVARRLVVELTYEGRSDINVLEGRRAAVSRTFEPLYRAFIANYDGPPVRPEDGSYLIITNDAFASAVQPFAEWKRRKGWRTKVVTTTEIGGIDTAHVYAYIHDAYQNWPYPPDHVLLVGDAPEYVDCNHWPGYTDASDLYYSLHAGADMLADLMISRACVRTPAEAQAVLNKLYKYERDPYIANTEWFDRVVALAGYESSPRFWSVVIRIRNYVMGRPFTQFDTLFERWGLNTTTNLTESLNQGRSWMLYRGHGEEQGWANVSPSWNNTNVTSLSNGRMVPMVMGPTCLSGDFDYSGDCHAETWVKAGEEKGGCGYFGASEASYSGYNDTLALGAFMSYTDSTHFSMAQFTQFGKLLMLQAYPLPDNISEEELYMFNNFGEPELSVWSAYPRTLTVDHPATVLIGSFPFTVTVNSSDAPVQGALVCVMSRTDTTVYHVGHTDGAGQVQFTLVTTTPGDSILVTVTGRNLMPYLATVITLAPNSAYVTYLRGTIDDAAGNGDGIINPGEAIELPAWVKNWGSVTANSVVGRLRTTDPNITITDSVKSFGNIAAGDSAYTGADGFDFAVAAGCTNGYALRFSMVLRDANDSVWTSSIGFTVGSPVMGYADNLVFDPPPGGNGDGKVDPGETARLLVTLANSGFGHGYNVAAKLRSGDTRFQILDSTAAYGLIPAESSGINSLDSFVVYADPSIPREVTVPCTLIVTADGGYARTVPFGLMIGEIRSVDPIPDGPRTPALYWAYDDADTFYTECPTFAWVEIAGIGTRLTLSDDETTPVSIPSGFGPFRFYNQNYTTLSISSNGFVAMGSTTTSTYIETALPNSAMPPGFYLHWDDLYPPTGGGVWYYHDAANHRFIVEFDSVPFWRAQTDYQKFEAIFYDTTLAAADGNCEVEYMYQIASDPSSCTVGEQDQTFAIFIQNLFDGAYHRGSMPIEAGRAIRYTTDEPITGIAEHEAGVAGIGQARFAVWPNPVRGRALVRFGVTRAQPVKLAVYDLSGRSVRGLVNGRLGAGSYSLVWDGCDGQGRRLAQGVYFVRLETGSERVAVKTLLLE